MPQPRLLLTTGEAARKLRTSDETIRRWIAEGKLPAITLPSGQFRIRDEDVEAILRGDTEAVTL
jgi:excisionase family DNA binding protein